MPTVGIRELKSQTSEIVRLVREERVEYVVTLRGEPVAMLLPVEPRDLEAEVLRGSFPAKSSGQAVRDEQARQRAIAIAGKFRSDVTDLSTQHDRYLAEAFAE